MNKRALRNYVQAVSTQVERKKMYKAKKHWVVAGMSFLIATGLGAIGNHLTHADSTNNVQANQTRLASGAQQNSQKAQPNSISVSTSSTTPQSVQDRTITSQARNKVGTIFKNNQYRNLSTTNVVPKHQLGQEHNIGSSIQPNPSNSDTWPGNMYSGYSQTSDVHSDTLYSEPSDIPTSTPTSTVAAGTYTYDTGQRHDTGTTHTITVQSNSIEASADQGYVTSQVQFWSDGNGAEAPEEGGSDTIPGPTIYTFHDTTNGNTYGGQTGNTSYPTVTVTVPSTSDVWSDVYSQANNSADITYTKIYQTKNGNNYGYVPSDNGWVSLGTSETPQSPWKLVDLTDNITYKYINHANKALTIGTGAIKGKPYQTTTISDNINQLQGLPQGYQLVNPKQKVKYDRNLIIVYIKPIIKTDTIVYQSAGTNHTIASATSSGEDYQASQASDTSFNINTSNEPNLPSKSDQYYLLNSSSNPINYDGSTHYLPVSLKPTSFDVNNYSESISNFISDTNLATKEASQINAIASGYASSASADINGSGASGISNQYSQINAEYSNIAKLSLSASKGSLENHVTPYVSNMNDNITKSSYTSGNVILSKAVSDEKSAQSMFSNVENITSTMASELSNAPCIYDFPLASADAENVASIASENNSNTNDNSLKASVINSIIDDDAANVNIHGYINSASINSQVISNSTQNSNIDNLVKQERSNNSQAQSYYDAARKEQDNSTSNYSATSADLSNAYQYTNKAKSSEDDINNILNSMNDIQPEFNDISLADYSSLVTHYNREADKNSNLISASTSLAEKINSTAAEYEKGANYDKNSSAITNQFNNDNSNYSEINSLLSSTSSVTTQFNKANSKLNIVN